MTALFTPEQIAAAQSAENSAVAHSHAVLNRVSATAGHLDGLTMPKHSEADLLAMSFDESRNPITSDLAAGLAEAQRRIRINEGLAPL